MRSGWQPLSNRKVWLPSHTALLAYYSGKNWPDWRIARKLGFGREAVTRRRLCMGLSCAKRERPVMMLRMRRIIRAREVIKPDAG